MPEEQTFRSYSKVQGDAYASVRLDYDLSVYKAVLDWHTANGGRFNSLIDVGCGPGTATFGLAPKFDTVIGLDPSEGMIATARMRKERMTSLPDIRFEISTAEDIGSELTPPVADGSVDLIISATAAHWFDMRRFWPSAARVLKPGGSVALWCAGAGAVHPSSTNAAQIQAAVDEYYQNFLRPYIERGNLLAAGLYAELPLPWDLPEPVKTFSSKNYERREWTAGEEFYKTPSEVDMATFEKMLATSSAYARWSQAHPNDVGTERDGIKVLSRKVEELLSDPDHPGRKPLFKGCVPGVLLLFKKN